MQGRQADFLRNIHIKMMCTPVLQGGVPVNSHLEAFGLSNEFATLQKFCPLKKGGEIWDNSGNLGHNTDYWQANAINVIMFPNYANYLDHADYEYDKFSGSAASGYKAEFL